MPQASDALRDKWGGKNGIGEDKACKYLKSKGYILTRRWSWFKPNPDHIVTEDESEALWFLIDEWDWDGIEDDPTIQTMESYLQSGISL